MGRNGAREAQRFTWGACASRTLEVYRSVARPARPFAGPMVNLVTGQVVAEASA
jgi:hypothetical protein